MEYEHIVWRAEPQLSHWVIKSFKSLSVTYTFLALTRFLRWQICTQKIVDAKVNKFMIDTSCCMSWYLVHSSTYVFCEVCYRLLKISVREDNELIWIINNPRFKPIWKSQFAYVWYAQLKMQQSSRNKALFMKDFPETRSVINCGQYYWHFFKNFTMCSV